MSQMNKKTVALSFLSLVSLLEYNDVFCSKAFAGFSADPIKIRRFNIQPISLKKPKSMINKEHNKSYEVKKKINISNYHNKTIVDNTRLYNKDGISQNYNRETDNNGGNIVVQHSVYKTVDKHINNKKKNIVIGDRKIKSFNKMNFVINLRPIKPLSSNFVASQPKHSSKNNDYSVTFTNKSESLINEKTDINYTQGKNSSVGTIQQNNVTFDKPAKFDLSTDKQMMSEKNNTNNYGNKKHISDSIVIYAPNIPVREKQNIENNNLQLQDIKQNAINKKENTEKILIEVDKELKKTISN